MLTYLRGDDEQRAMRHARPVIRQHSIRQHTLACAMLTYLWGDDEQRAMRHARPFCISIQRRTLASTQRTLLLTCIVSIRQHTSAYVSVRHTSAYVSRRCTLASPRRALLLTCMSSAYVSIRSSSVCCPSQCKII